MGARGNPEGWKMRAFAVPMKVQPADWEKSPENGVFSHRFRYLILVLGFLCLTSVASNVIVINFTFICMNDPNDLVLTTNGVRHKKP